MKIYKLILLAVWALSFVACEKDPDPQITVPESISLGVDATITTFEVSSNVAWKMTVQNSTEAWERKNDAENRR